MPSRTAELRAVPRVRVVAPLVVSADPAIRVRNVDQAPIRKIAPR
jgi:hypothetical protein